MENGGGTYFYFMGTSKPKEARCYRVNRWLAILSAGFGILDGSGWAIE
jgi:hypothetical protein